MVARNSRLLVYKDEDIVCTHRDDLEEFNSVGSSVPIKHSGGYDENIASEIKDIKVELVEQYSRERDEALERARILLVENRDLKDFLIEKRLMTEEGEVIEY